MSISPRATLGALRSETEAWYRTASEVGIDARYTNGLGEACCAPLDTVRGALEAMGAPTRSTADAAGWVRQLGRCSSPLEVHWEQVTGLEDHTFGCTSDQGKWILRAPSRYPSLDAPRVGRFLPLYALRSRQSLGIGDLSDLGDLVEACRDDFVATLPLFATFVDDGDARFDPSPYAPVSRSFFSELYLDPRRTEEWAHCPEAQSALADSRAALDEELARPHVDYALVARLRRPVLECLAKAYATSNPTPDGEAREELEAYAEFRARGAADAGFHRYVQLRLAEQLAHLSSRGALYLDLPVGVHRGGFDAERFAEDFLPGFSAGAPPDAMFRSGQCWGISALNPIGARRSAYASFRSGVASLARYARLLRLDHVMALHRTFCVPDGAEASEGVYIRANAEELYAALLATAASAEATPVLIGEDLGTVPDAVRVSLIERGVLGMHVAQLDPSLPVKPGTCASVNTHDLATFAAYRAGDDLRDFAKLGFLSSNELAGALRARRRSVASAGDYDALKTRLLESQAAHVVLNLEDEWAELRPQNTPGTSSERANFKRRASKPLQEITSLMRS